MNIPFLQVEPTTKCNFTCGFCVGRHMVQRHMEKETFRDVINAVAGLEHISIQGEGEPLLNRDFMDMIGMVKTQHPNAKISFISNGSLFSKKNIDGILFHGVNRIMVSIESPDEETFREIRGGKLSKVKAGIRALLEERDRRLLVRPVIGFAVTVMKKTMHEYRGILKLYEELGMDGGFTCQFLQNMEIYTRYYDEAMMQELLSSEDAEAFGGNINNDPLVLNILNNSQKHSNFYSDVYSSASEGCPWLSNGFYVNIDGIASGCCYIKDSQREGFGILNKESISDILLERQRMQSQLLSGIIPKACAGCSLAKSIQQKVHST